MCNPVSMIVKHDGTVFLPATDAWNHSHTAIAAKHSIPDGEIGDRYARVEVRPPNDVFHDATTNEVFVDAATWAVVLDEQRAPGWWTDDKPAFEDKCRQWATRYMKSCNHCLLPGHRAQGGNRSTLTGGYGSTLTGGNGSTLTGGDESTLTGGYRSTLTGGDRSTLTGGDESTLTGGYRSTLTGGNYSTLTGGNYSTLTGGDRSTLTGGDFSTLTGGDFSTLTGGDRSTLTWKIWDGLRYRLHTFYTGEGDCKVGVKYRLENGKLVEVN
jgi:hypothetical protein